MRSLAKWRNRRLIAIDMLSAVIARLDRAIQYAVTSSHTTAVSGYWITRFRG